MREGEREKEDGSMGVCKYGREKRKEGKGKGKEANEKRSKR